MYGSVRVMLYVCDLETCGVLFVARLVQTLGWCFVVLVGSWWSACVCMRRRVCRFWFGVFVEFVW